MSVNLNNAIQFMKEKHKGQFRQGGLPYYIHPIVVMELLKSKGYADNDYLLTALFHDLLEDTDATEEEILKLSNENVLVAVKLLTKKSGVGVGEYLNPIKSTHLAKTVKLADRLHNLQSAVVANEKFKKKYIKETEGYYLYLADGTDFYDDILDALNKLKKSIEYVDNRNSSMVHMLGKDGLPYCE